MTSMWGLLCWILHGLLAFACPPGTDMQPAPLIVTDLAEDGLFREPGIRESAQGGFRFKVNVDLVTVDAIVRDREGNSVDGLQAEDFVLYDNGAAQQVTLFSRDELPLAVALLLDRSPSVANYLSEFRTTAWMELERFKPADRVVLFSFDQFPSRLTDLTEDRRLIATRVGEIVMGVNTNIYDALIESAHYLLAEAPARRRAIIMISDNYTNLLHHDDKEALRAVLEASATLFSIKAPSEFRWAEPIKDPKFIEQIAVAAGGQVLDLNAAETLSGALDKAIAHLRRGYTIGFTPSRPDAGDTFHKLTVKLAADKRCQGCTIQARSGYYARKRAP